MVDKLSKKTALITGSAQGIGAEIALSLAVKGYDIIIHYNKSEDDAKALRQKIISNARVNCYIMQADLTDTKQIYKLVKEVKNNFKNWSLLINNASIFNKSDFINSDIDELNYNFDIHLKAPLILSQEFLKYCQECELNGNIINMIDKNITRYDTKYFSYLLSKKSLSEFTKMAAIDLAAQIRINAIAPGIIDNHISNFRSKEELNNIIDKIPLKRLGNIDNIIKAIDYLLNNDFVTGQILYVDGGASLNHAG